MYLEVREAMEASNPSADKEPASDEFRSFMRRQFATDRG
jgi:hypothetical protein